MDTTQPTAEAHRPAPYQPTIRDTILLEIPLDIRVSPSGHRAALLVRTTDWLDNRYRVDCRVHDVTAGATYRLTHTGDVLQAEWIDDRTLALLRPGADGRAQIWLYEDLIGDGWPVTDHPTGVEWFKPFAGGFLYRARDPERLTQAGRAGRIGSFTHVEREESAAALYYVGLAELVAYRARARAATAKEAAGLTPPILPLSPLLGGPAAIHTVVASPTDDMVVINGGPRDDVVYPDLAYSPYTTATLIKLDAPAAMAEHRAGQPPEALPARVTRLHLPPGALVVAFSPDGRQLLVECRERDTKWYTRPDLWVVDLDAAVQAPDATTLRTAMRNLTAPHDLRMFFPHWLAGGIIGAYADGTHGRLGRLALDGRCFPLDLQDVFPVTAFHAGASGRIGLIGSRNGAPAEAYLARPAADNGAWQLTQLTDFDRQTAHWDLGTVETFRWTSRDGTEIEGVLRKPADFCPTRRYPLALVVHGGPAWFSAEHLLADDDLRTYPVTQLVNQGVIVLKPNYRGSIGRSQAFHELNVDHLGTHEWWDLESAIDALVALGWVDEMRVGCMGWSHGGYLAAFGGLASDRFRAVSVGAGISDFYTHHISTDIPHFTVDHLGGSPFRDREPYTQAAPITYLHNARTPVLIQHGGDDRRVPPSNATELYRGLKEMGVPVELFLYPGMGHEFHRPHENHAVMQQNLAWFGHYLLGQTLTWV
jgi:dipeptidyl aminopeptidase/acylaminoacyl peptidase